MTALPELARLFLRLGFTAFGGPAAHIAMMEDEIVKRRQWLDHHAFLDLLGATNLIPGPNSTELALHIGYVQAGFAGLLVAGLCFLFPAILMSGIIAFFYVEYGALPAIAPLLIGIKPAVLVIIFKAVKTLSKKALKGKIHIGVFVASLGLGLLQINEAITIIACGIAGMLWIRLVQDWGQSENQKDKGSISKSFFALPLLPFASLSLPNVVSVSLGKLFFIFLKIGAILFGSGYVLIAFLEGDLVASTGWLTEQQLLDAVAIGQFTPGPVLSTSTFIGYIVAGPAGAVVATIGIFLPSFVYVTISNRFIPKLRQSKWASAFLDSVNAAAMGVMAAVLIQLAIKTLIDPTSLVILLGVLIVYWRFPKMNSAWLIALGAVLGLAGYFILG